MKRLLVCVGALAALTVGSTRVEAFPISINPLDGSYVAVFDEPASGQAACATCSVTATFDFNATGTQLVITVDNTSTSADSLANVLAAFGFNSTPNLTDGTLGGFFATGWTLSYSSAGGGLGGTWDLIADANNGTFFQEQNDPVGTITFNFNPALGSFSIDDALVHIQRTGADRSGSTKFTCCDEGNGQEQEGAGPEPASLLLFGMALSAAGLRMRRVRA